MEICIIFLFFAISYGKWDKMHILTEKIQILRSGFTDPISHITHFFAKDFENQKFGYIQINQDKLLNKIEFFEESYKNIYSRNINFMGYGNGENVFAVFNILRQDTAFYNSECNQINTNGCKEIIFLESDSNGERWASPIKIRRNNMNDSVNRENEILIYIIETGDIYIFYTKQDTDFNSVIAYVTRFENQLLFSNEKILDFGINMNLLDVKYTINEGKITWHFIVSTDNKNIVYFSTENFNKNTPFVKLYEKCLLKSTNLLTNSRASQKTINLVSICENNRQIMTSYIFYSNKLEFFCEILV